MHSTSKVKIGEARSILHYTGFMCIFLGLLMLIPIVVALIYGEYKYILPFIYSALISIFIGFSFYKIFNKDEDLSLRGAMIFATGIWLVACALSALPFYFSGDLSYLDGYFEAMSGYTTTGFSMYTNLNAAAFTMDFWRGFMQWLGGVGIIVMALTILSSPNVNIMRMYAAEGRDERIKPSIRHTARVIFYIYVIYTVIGIILFKLAGMPLFDSVFYTFSALSTGGFAMQNTSLAFYHNIWIELVAIIIMIIGATNFALHHMILPNPIGRGKWREYFKDIETKVAYPLLIIGTILVAVFLYNTPYYGHDFLLSLRLSVFQVVSALTTTGLQTSSGPEITTQYAGMGIFILTILMIIGAGSCSTGGGIKWIRIGIMVKEIWWEIKSYLLPQSAKISKKIHHLHDITVDKDISRLTGLFVFIFLFVYLVSVIITLFYYQNVSQVLFEVASAISNVGLTASLITASSPAIIKVLFIFDMWTGRLEIWPIMIFMAIILKNTIRT
jgi:trk system potassium uptake protein TrkH